MIKILGIILVFIACFGLSQKRIIKQKKSSVEIRSLISGLKEIADNISFFNKPLPEIISSVTEHNGNVFFSKICDILSHDEKIRVEKAWEKALLGDELDICKSAKEPLLTLGKTIGKQTAQKEEENIGICIGKLTDILEEEERLSAKNTKMIQSLGVLSGLMIVILFI